MLTVHDFIMLGKTVPEPQSDGRVFVCSAGYSPTLRKLIRIYPLAMQSAPAMWSVSRVTLERNPKDSREESFRLVGDRNGEAHQNINTTFEHVRDIGGDERERLIASIQNVTKKQANADRMSLAIVQPDHPPRLRFTENIEADDHPQMSLFARTDAEKQELGSKRFPFQPRVTFSIGGASHDLQLRDWGSYEWLRKRGAAGRYDHPAHARLAENPRLLVGNMNGHRNVWLVISMLRPVAQPDLFAGEVAA